MSDDIDCEYQDDKLASESDTYQLKGTSAITAYILI